MAYYALVNKANHETLAFMPAVQADAYVLENPAYATAKYFLPGTNTKVPRKFDIGGNPIDGLPRLTAANAEGAILGTVPSFGPGVPMGFGPGVPMSFGPGGFGQGVPVCFGPGVPMGFPGAGFYPGAYYSRR